jgi:hypothetical protein
LFYLCLAVPIAGLALSFRRGRRLAAAHLVVASLLVLLLDIAFLRDVLTARVADVVAPMAVVAAAIAGHLWPPATLRRASVVVLVIAVPFAAAALTMRARGATATLNPVGRVSQVTRRLLAASPEIQPNPRLAPLVAYLARCTGPGERILVSGFGPELPILAGRPFAGGLSSWIPGYYEDAYDVDRAVAQLDRERVGAAVMLDGSRVFFLLWPRLGDWLRSHSFEEYALTPINDRVRVWLPSMTRRAPVDMRTGLPCPVP